MPCVAQYFDQWAVPTNRIHSEACTKIICGKTILVITKYVLKLSSLVDRRRELCKAFFEKSVLDSKNCLHYLLPPRRLDAAHKLRVHLPYIPQIPQTSRYYYSFIPFALNNYISPGSLLLCRYFVIYFVIAAYSICILICDFIIFSFIYSINYVCM